MIQTKICTKCNIEQGLEFFPKSEKHRFGVHSICKKCTKVRADNWYINNRARRLQAGKDWIKRNPDKAREIAKKADLNWRSKNQVKDTFRAARRRAYIRGATPSWADKSKMLQIYSDAIARTNETGFRYEVDHIVPLQSELVCGLHCESNLRIISATENCRKRNFYWPDMP